ncbi:hypothetical protein ACT4US_34125, partial [Bacillus sp. HC-Mk]
LEALYEKRQHESGMTKAQFAELIETSPAALSQLLGPNPHRNIGDKMARKIETALWSFQTRADASRTALPGWLF